MTCGTSSTWLAGSMASGGETGAMLESALDTPDVNAEVEGCLVFSVEPDRELDKMDCASVEYSDVLGLFP